MSTSSKNLPKVYAAIAVIGAVQDIFFINDPLEKRFTWWTS